MRIGYARINQETHCLSPIRTTLEDFQRAHFLVGDALAEAASRKGSEVPGLLKDAELSGVVRALESAGATAVPLSSAWAMPSGPLTRECVVQLRDQLVGELQRAGKLDGLVLAFHGAMGAHGLDEPESWLLEAIRDQVGDIPVVLTLDLHGLVTRRMALAVDAILAYRTNPHRDHKKTGRKAAELVLRMAAGLKPAMAWRSLPMVLGGGTTVDFLAPMRAIFRDLSRVERQEGVLSTSLFMCHLWNSSQDLGWSIVVVTEGDQGQAERLADELAEAAWAVRHELPPELLTPEQAIQQAKDASLRRKLGAVTMADASDVVGAGAPGANTRLIAALMDQAQGLRCYAPVRDAEAAGRIWDAAEGTELELELGEPALKVRGRVGATSRDGGMGLRGVLDCGDVKLVVTEQAPLVMDPRFYGELGLSPWKADVMVVKSFFHFRWHYILQNRLSLYVRTEGITDFDALRGRVDFRDPVSPYQHVEDWRPADRRRRLGG
jgi:microcystin degradation protein MlrC